MALPENAQALPAKRRLVTSPDSALVSRPDRREGGSSYDIETWKKSDVPALVALEQLWAPWLRKSQADFLYIADHFPDVQRIARPKTDPDTVAGQTTVIQINWGGPEKDDFTTWDKITGGPDGSVKNSNFSETFRRDGNTYVLTAATVDPTIRIHGERLAPQLVTSVVDMASRDPNILYVISAFRPSDLGKYEQEHGPIDFDKYVKMQRGDGELHDTWLRGVTNLGMIPIRTIKDSMRVTATREEFEGYKRDYHRELWKPITEDRRTWLCGETGTWQIVGDPHNPDPNAVYAEYKEDNLLGLVYSKQPSSH